MTIEYTNKILSNVTKNKSNINGLKWIPSLEPHNNDDSDDYKEFSGKIPVELHFSDLNHQILRSAYNSIKRIPELIVEIGVDASPVGNSSTSTLLNLKPKECVYLGVDTINKSYLDDVVNNIFTIQSDSLDKQKILEFMDRHSRKKIDFMFIDGWHSINQVLGEWQYWEFMAADGVMAFHDTNFHPGPVTLIEAIDETLFSVECYGRNTLDWGISVVRRIN